MPEIKKGDGFFKQVDKFFKRAQNKDLLKLSSNSINVMSAPQSKDEAKTKRELQVFKQYLQSKNWNLKHIELFDEYRRMDATFPLINAALRLYSQELCYSIDTQVVMLDNSVKTLRQLIDSNQKEFWVWGYDENEKRIVPVKCDKAVSKGYKEILEIHLDDGTVLKCTSEHKHLLKSGEWKMAKDLCEGDSLRSIYSKIDNNGYLQLSDGSVCKQNHKKLKWKAAHSIVGNLVDFLITQKENLEKNKFEIKRDNMPVVHHASFNKLNNDPNALQWLLWGDHSKIHQNGEQQKRKWREDIAFRERMIEKIRECSKRFWGDPIKAKRKAEHHSKKMKEIMSKLTVEERKKRCAIPSEKHNWRKEIRGCTSGGKNPHANSSKKYFEDFSIEYLDEQTKRYGTKEMFYNALNCTPETLEKYFIAKNVKQDYISHAYTHLIPIVEELIQNGEINYPYQIKRVLAQKGLFFYFVLNSFAKVVKKNGYENIGHFFNEIKEKTKEFLKVNHKVVSVIFTKEIIEVGDVINAGDVHNFAVKCNEGQIIVHNCLSGDSIITTSEGDRTIKQAYDQHKELFLVQSYDYKNNRVSWNECHGIISKGKKDVYEVTVQKNITKKMMEWDRVEIAKFKCTIDHKIYIGQQKYKTLSELNVGDTIFAYYRDIDPSCSCKIDTFLNTVVLKIEHIGEEEVFDLYNVTPTPHFSLKLTDSFYVVVHNCSKDTDGNIIKIISEDLPIKKSLEECYFKNLKLNTRGYLIAKSLLKFGNLYGYLNTRRGVGVTDLIYLPPESMRIHLLENSERLDEFKYHWWGYGSGLQFDPWEIVHWKIVEDLESEPYGQSILRAIVDTWRRIVLMREALIIYRITRAPQRYMFKIDTSGMDPDAALLYADQMKKNLMKKPLVNPTTGEMDYKYNAMPISGRTPIPLLDGRIKSISELAKEYEEGKENYVYSIQDETHQIVPGKIKWCGKNYTANKLIKVWLDNNSYVITAPEHPFILRSTKSIRADELKEGDSLMPFYQDLYGIVNGNKKSPQYERTYNPATQKYEYTHKLIAKEIKEKEISLKNEIIINTFKAILKRDLNKKYIDFKNDVLKNNYSHYKNHKISKVEILENVNEDVYCMTVVGPKGEDDRHNFALLGSINENEYSNSGIFVKNSIEENFYIPVTEGSMSDISVIEGANNMDQIEDYRIIMQDLYTGLMVPNAFLNMEQDLSNKAALCIRQNTLICTNEGSLTIKRISELFEKNKTTKLFTLSVNEFGLITSGEIVKCWATKEVNTLYKIHLSNDTFVECTENHPFLLHDKMEYKRADELQVGDRIKNKYESIIIVSAIEVIDLKEKEWVYDIEVNNYHNLCLDCGIFVHNSQEDLRFSSAVRQYQSYFIEGLLHIGLVQLYLNGFGKDELEAFEIQMNNNSTLAEKNKNELLQQRFDLAHSALDTSSGGISVMSYIDVLKNILKFSDEEISNTFKNQMIEKKLIWRLNQLADQGYYEEPDPDKKKAIMKGMTDSTEDVFKDLQFESLDSNLGTIKTILNEKLMKEINYLCKPLKERASSKQINMIVDLQKERIRRNITKTYADLGLKDRNILKEEDFKTK